MSTAVNESPYTDLIARALLEDVGCGDITTKATVDPTARAQAKITQKQPGVIYGLAVAAETFIAAADGDVLEIVPCCEEGVFSEQGAVMTVTGSARTILIAERTALNFLQHLSGIATLTAQYVQAITGTGAQLLDTRKTTPGLRALEKAAVVAGGGVNHRAGLYDAILIKENHIALNSGIMETVARVKKALPTHSIEIECRDFKELDEAIAAGVDRVLLDNMSVEQVAEATKRVAGQVQLEASGGISLKNVRSFAETGVNFISVGAVTHSAPALDMSLTFETI